MNHRVTIYIDGHLPLELPVIGWHPLDGCPMIVDITGLVRVDDFVNENRLGGWRLDPNAHDALHGAVPRRQPVSPS